MLFESVVVDGDTLRVRADAGITERWLREDFWARYPSDVDLQALPQSVLAVPFLLNIAPVVWLSGETLRVAELDSALARALDRLRAVIRDFYPREGWQGEIVADRLVDDADATSAGPTAMLFSGGVDSVYTSQQIPDHQLLITIRGADIPLDNHAGWEATLGQATRFAEHAGHRKGWVETNFKDMLRYDRLARDSFYGDWWGQVQHAMAMLGLSAPLLAANGSSRLAIAASVAPGGRPAPWGSHPDLDHNVAWGGVKVEPHGEDAGRQQKIASIVDSPTVPPLRVCWVRPELEGTNCGDCEKCLATATGLMLAGADPAAYGFPRPADQVLAAVKRRFTRHSMEVTSACSEARWREIKQLANSGDARLAGQRAFVRWLGRLPIEGYMRRRAIKDRLMTPVRRLGLR